MSSEFILAPGEEFVQCPYNTAHQITNARFLTHLDKCRKSYIKTESQAGRKCEMAICRFNATHHILKPEIKLHESNCPDANSMLTFLDQHSTQGQGKETNVKLKGAEALDWTTVGKKDRSNPCVGPITQQTLPSSFSTEDWEEEASGCQPGYDPLVKLKSEFVMYNPGGLTKSERKKYRNEVRTRHAERILTGQKVELPVPNKFEFKPSRSDRQKTSVSSQEPMMKTGDHNLATKAGPSATFQPSALASSSRFTVSSSDQRPGPSTAIGRDSTNGKAQLKEWPWKDDPSDYHPDDTDDFEGYDPYDKNADF